MDTVAVIAGEKRLFKSRIRCRYYEVYAVVEKVVNGEWV